MHLFLAGMDVKGEIFIKISVPKILTAIGSLILLTVAYMHFGGLASLKPALSDLENDFFRRALPGVWIMPSVHMVFIACIAFGLSFYNSKAGTAVLLAFGILCLVDAALVFSHVGAFIAVYMLMAAGLCFLISAILLRRGHHD